MTRQEMIDLIGWHYQTMTEEEKNILSRVEHIVEVSVLREREACAKAVEIFDKTFQTGGGIAGAIRARSDHDLL